MRCRPVECNSQVPADSSNPHQEPKNVDRSVSELTLIVSLDPIRQGNKV